MQLQRLQQRIREIGDPVVLGLEQKVGGSEYSLLGWTGKGQETRLVAVLWDPEAEGLQEGGPEHNGLETGLPSSSDHRERMHWNNRQRLLHHLCQDRPHPLQHAYEVTLGGRAFPVREVTSTRLDPLDWESVVLLTLFLRAGWKPERLVEADYEQMLLITLSLEGTDDLPAAALAKTPVSVAVRGAGTEHPVGLQMQLPVGEAGEDPALYPRVTFSDAGTGEPHWMQIERVVLFDPWKQVEETVASPAWAEQMTSAEREETRSRLLASIAEHCPRGMRYPVIEYECEEGISLRFHALSYLDEVPVPGGSGGAFGIIAGATGAGRSGIRLRSAAVETPVPEGTESIAVELFAYRREYPERRIEFMER
jgi:hypothetical protein